MASTKSKSRDSEKKGKSVKTKKVTEKTPPSTTYKSEEFVQDSDEDEKDKDEAADEDSDEGSDSDGSLSSAEPVKSSSKANGKLPAPSGSSSSSEGESEESDDSSEEEEESDDSSEEEEDSEDTTKEAPVAIEPTKRPSKQAATNTVSFKAPSPYRPPPGFDLASLDGPLKASQMLKKSSLEGKQIWYFTAPASVPISSIEALSLPDAKNGKTVLMHEGNDYGFMKDSSEDMTYTRIMVPSSDAGYKATSKAIDQVFHLQQIARDPATTNPAKATIPAKKPVRQQPRGLKMRFHPIGFGPAQPGTIGSISSDDEEMEDAPSATTNRPVSKPKSTARPDEDSDEEMKESPPLPWKPHPEINASVSSPDGASKKEKKRKHSEGGEKKSKHSSSSVISTIDHRELKRLKKKQTESQRNLADNRSASIENEENTDPPLPLRPKTPPKYRVSTTPIPPPKPLTFSQPSAAYSGSLQSKSSSKKSKSTEGYRSSSMTPSTSSHLPHQESSRATGPKLTGEERQEKKKKLKHKDAKRQKGGSA